MAYKSKYNPENQSKYIGNTDKIICRSLWERKVCKYLDKNENVVRWGSEEFFVPYTSPIDKKQHKYYPDFIAEIKQKDGSIQTYVIEVKPDKQTRPPVKPKKQTKTYRTNVFTYLTNEAKWIATESVCEEKDWKFVLLTEKHIFKDKK